ncbi:MAG: ferredoxin--NADP reductase [Pirellulales bacterium]|nr:ferredoxin--NADP reductase [Pirellulales bacterium]
MGSESMSIEPEKTTTKTAESTIEKSLYNATITKSDEINHGLLVLRVVPDDNFPQFTPGQYAVLGLPGTASRVEYADPESNHQIEDRSKLIKRAYSVTSSSLKGEYLEFYVALVHSGELTPRIFALKKGDRIFLGKKIVGMFTLQDVPSGNDLLFVATGTGLAPYISMLRSEYDFLERKTIIIHGARTSWDLGYRNMLEALAAKWPNFHYLPIINEIERDPGWEGAVGLVYEFFEDGTVESILGRDVQPADLATFLCGHPLMVQGMIEFLAKKGFTRHSRKNPGSIFVEEYWKE